MDNKTCKVVVKGWKHHVNVSQDGTSSLKPEVEWTNAKDNVALENSKALNAIFNGVDNNMFRLINTCNESKDT